MVNYLYIAIRFFTQELHSILVQQSNYKVTSSLFYNKEKRLLRSTEKSSNYKLLLSMTKQEKVDFAVKTLQELYPQIPIPLDHKDPYTLLIAVLLSAQSTDVRVNQITPLLFEVADNPYDMIKLSVEEIRDIIRPVGLSPMKSKGIHGLSHILIDKYNGVVPASIEKLTEFPAVGHKTASVVVSQAFGIPAFPVDTHIHRLMYRWGFTNGKNVVQTERDAKRLFPEHIWNDLHLQIIWYGREYSPARGWDLEKDIITKTIGRKTVIADYEKMMAKRKKK